MKLCTGLTKKQETTIVLFAQNYSLPAIAKKQDVCLCTIRERIKALWKKCPKELTVALSIRSVYKRNRDSLRTTTDFQSHRRINDAGVQADFEEFICEGHNGVKRTF